MAQRHMDRLTSFDTSFLANEKSNGHMAIGAVLVCEGEPPSHEEFLASIRSRLHLLPRLRQRLSYPPLGLGRPFWVDHPEFDVHEHVSRKVLDGSRQRRAVPRPPSPRPSPRRSTARGRSGSCCLVEGIEDDRFAIVYKTHHAMADGISAVDIGVLLFDVEPTTEPVPEPAPWEPKTAALADRAGRARGAPAFGQMFVRAGRWLRRRLPQAAPRRQARLRRHRRPLGGHLEPRQAGAEGAAQRRHLARGAASTAPAATSTSSKQIKNALGATVNDVTLAVDRRRPAPLDARPRAGDRGGRAAGAGAGLDPHRRRARRARQQTDGDARAAAGRHRRPGRAAALRLQGDGRRSRPPSSRSAPRRSGASTTGSATSRRRCCSARPRRSTSRPGSSTCSSPTSPARRSPSTCSAASWSRSTRSASSPAATRWRSRSSATTARSASACSATATRWPTSTASAPTSSRPWRSSASPPG